MGKATARFERYLKLLNTKSSMTTIAILNGVKFEYTDGIRLEPQLPAKARSTHTYTYYTAVIQFDEYISIPYVHIVGTCRTFRSGSRARIELVKKCIYNAQNNA